MIKVGIPNLWEAFEKIRAHPGPFVLGSGARPSVYGYGSIA